jgi:hypothetical protein
LPLAEALYQLDAGDRVCRMTELLEAKHHCDTLLDAPMVLLNQVIQVLRARLPTAVGMLRQIATVSKQAKCRRYLLRSGLFNARWRRRSDHICGGEYLLNSLDASVHSLVKLAAFDLSGAHPSAR